MSGQRTLVYGTNIKNKIFGWDVFLSVTFVGTGERNSILCLGQNRWTHISVDEINVVDF